MANKEQAKVLQPENKVTQAKKNLPTATKIKRDQTQAAHLKKRRFAFFSDIIAEMKKVIWPTRQETLRLTLIVLGICLAMGLILGAIDYGFSELVARVLLSGK